MINLAAPLVLVAILLVLLGLTAIWAIAASARRRGRQSTPPQRSEGPDPWEEAARRMGDDENPANGPT